MAKTATKIAQPEPKLETPETDVSTNAKAEATTEPKHDPLAGSRRFNIPQFVTVNSPKEETLGQRAERLSAIKQSLAEARDMAAEGGEKAEAASLKLGECGRQLFEMRSEGVIGPDVVTATLGDIFGFQKRGKGGSKIKVPAGSKDASATPFGAGDVIRKRIVRMTAASDFIVNGNRSAFFEGLKPEEVSPIVETLQDGGSIWRAYEQLTELKSSKRETRSAAFNPKSIATIDEKLSEPGALDVMLRDNELRVAYNNLVGTLVPLMAEVNDMLAAEAAEQANG